jgi:hypothetical protein
MGPTVCPKEERGYAMSDNEGHVAKFRRIKARALESGCAGLDVRMVQKEGSWYAKFINNGSDIEYSPSDSSSKDIVSFIKNSHKDVMWLIERLENNSRVLLRDKVDKLEGQIEEFKEANRRIYSKYRSLKESKEDSDSGGGLLLTL